jgi:glycine betaine/proline transport system permease protein
MHAERAHRTDDVQKPTVVGLAEEDASEFTAQESVATETTLPVMSVRSVGQWALIAAMGPLWSTWYRKWMTFAAFIVADVLAITVMLHDLKAGMVVFVLARAAIAAGILLTHHRIAIADFRYGMLRIFCGALLYLLLVPLVAYRLQHQAPIARECRAVFRDLGVEISGLSQSAIDCFLLSDVPIRVVRDVVGQSIDSVIDFLTRNFQAFFDSIAFAVRTVLLSLEALFVGTPWPVTLVLLVLASYVAANWRVAAFCALSLGYLVLFGFWASAMSTLVLVGAAALISIGLGIPIGIWCAKDARVYAVVRPMLDIMQTVPSFVYLIPAIAFFSIGKTPGVLATVVYSSPVMIRLTALGILQVPHAVREAAWAFGATPFQLLRKVELPLSIPSLMTGMNQTVMMSLSMSVAAALIGAGGLGYDVLFALQNVEPGSGLLAGLAIAVCAMIIDRTIQGSQKQIPRSL